jgi:hypothetical protein
MKLYSEQLHTSTWSLFFPCVFSPPYYSNMKLVHSDGRPILSDPRAATWFQGTEEASVHPRAGYIGTDQRL